MIALVDFEAVYDGQVIALKAGLDQVSPDHELVRRYPERFARDSVDYRARTGMRAGRRRGAWRVDDEEWAAWLGGASQ
jgi:hypothetical protein